MKESPGSGSAMIAEKKDRTKEIIVDRRIEWTQVLLVPFHIPQDPSAAHREDSTANSDEDDLRSRA